MTRFTVILALFLAGCGGAEEKRFEVVHLTSTLSQPLSETARFVVAVESDGRYRNIVTSGSGEMARRAMVAAISRYAGRVSTIKRFVPENEARAEAKRTGSDYLVFLRILNWEERVTAWSGMPDRLEIEIRTRDIGRNQVVDDRIITGNSAWATFGGDHVDHLLPEPFAGFAADIFGSTPIRK